VENKPTHEAFRGELNQTFLLQQEGAEPVSLELVKVSDLIKTPKQERFSLVFRANATTPLPQQIYSLENRSMGQIKLFLVPIGQEAEAVLYEAVFNRLVN
jgi:hypothetical protein